MGSQTVTVNSQMNKEQVIAIKATICFFNRRFFRPKKFRKIIEAKHLRLSKRKTVFN